MITSRLSKTDAVKSTNTNTFIKTNLINNQRLIPTNDYATEISEMEVYQQERENCDKYRIIVTINPLCSNVLYNRITEVIINENSDKCKCLNFLNQVDSVISEYPLLYKTANNFNGNKTVDGSKLFTRDTQLTRDECGAVYKCGVDIFNNHILRSNTFKCVCPSTGSTSEGVFNTIFDYMRESDGSIVSGYTTDSNDKIPLHLYLKEDVMDYDESVDANLDEDNGWVGFINKSKILTFTEKDESIYKLKKGDPLNINRVINNKPSCGFIDMCPERDLWYLTPKYNKTRNRFEQNWNYCLTYPYSSTTKDISFIREETNSLKALFFDDTVRVGGTNACKIVSICKHGLLEGDFINLYVNGTQIKQKKTIDATENVEVQEDQIIENLEVIKVDDEYSFYVRFSVSNWIKNKYFVNWKSDGGFETALVGKERASSYVWSTDARQEVRYTDENGNNYIFPVFIADDGSYCSNIDYRSNDISFKQVINNEEVQYYVRIFQKLPNWKFAEQRINEYTTDEERENLINKYSSKNYDFDSHLSKLAFAKNAYGDDISQIVFSDDVEISMLKDNLGRPVTDIYLTLLKNNAGYRKWYGKNTKKCIVNTEDIEYSHVFGKLSCAFELCPQSVSFPSHKNVLQTNNISNEYCMQGLEIKTILDSGTTRPTEIAADEIEYNQVDDYEGDNRFYGDICLYSPSTLAELVIDDIWFRFNTAQRELTAADAAYEYLSILGYDEIKNDDYDNGGFQRLDENKTFFKNACQSAEGYRYKPHYKISLKTFGKNLETATPYMTSIVSREHKGDDENKNESDFIITTDKVNYNELNDSIVIYNKTRNEYYIGTVTKIYDTTKFRCTLKKESPNKKLTVDLPELFDSLDSYVVIRKQETIPSNAILLKNGSLLYAWRTLYQNGMELYNSEEIYPFTNNALYVEKNVRLFVKRQDPNKTVGTLISSEINDIEPNKHKAVDENNYYNEQNISCF